MGSSPAAALLPESRAQRIARSAFRILGTAALLGLLTYLLLGGGSPLSSGTKAPAIHGVAVDGGPAIVDLADGTVTVVNIWGTWCPPCLAELPQFVEAAHAYDGGDGRPRVRFLGLAVQSDRRDVMKMQKRFGIPYDLATIDDATANAWNAHSVPDTYIIDGTGTVRWSITGGIDKKLLDEHLASLVR